jgi:hypothetical protein
MGGEKDSEERNCGLWRLEFEEEEERIRKPPTARTKMKSRNSNIIHSFERGQSL